jgi:hypothetical protein
MDCSWIPSCWRDGLHFCYLTEISKTLSIKIWCLTNIYRIFPLRKSRSTGQFSTSKKHPACRATEEGTSRDEPILWSQHMRRNSGLPTFQWCWQEGWPRFWLNGRV